MELVKGVPITEFCDKNHMPAEGRLKLFIDVCHAIQHAHHKGVIHRDIKPSNVMVTLHDGVPVVKVIDFGVAKATVQKLTEKTLFTAYGQMIGTPAYMSPEQAEMSGLDIDTRSDVYSLGVLLYELLTGTTPLEGKRLREAGYAEMQRLIREEEAPRPSNRLSSLGDSATVFAGNRGLDVRRLVQLLAGDLDWLVMKALEKDRNRRYGTPGNFAEDIERYLHREAILARPPSTIYKLKKFAQRNRAAVLTAAAILFVLLAGIAGTTFGLIRAEHRRVEAEQARADEAEQRSRAEKARDRTRDVLDAMTSSATEDSLSTQKEISADQKKFLTEVLTYYREFAGEQADDERTRARTAQAAHRVGRIEYRLGRKEQGIAAFQLARDGYRTLAADFPAVPAYRQNLAKNHNNLGSLLDDLGKRAEAQEQYRQALAIQEKLADDFPAVPDYRRELARSHNNLGSLLDDLGKRAEALERYREALAIQEKLAADFPAEPVDRMRLAGSHNNLGSLLADLGKPTVAQEHFRQALAIRTKLAADFPAVPDYRRELALSHYNLGVLLAGMRQPKNAEAQYRKALAIDGTLAADFPAVPAYRQALANSHNVLGVLLKTSGRPADAQEQYRQALLIREKLATDFPAEPAYKIHLGGSYCNYGSLIYDGGRAGESLGWFDKAIATLAPVHRAEPRDVMAKQFLRNSHVNRAITYDALAKPAEAVKDWDRAIELSTPAERPGFRASRATSQIQAGLVAEAVAEVAELTAPATAGSPKWNAGQWYDFACVYAVASGKIADKKQEYADRAMELLQQAVKAGYKDAAHLAKDKDLDPLREREDFKKLLAGLETKSNTQGKQP